MIQPGRAKLADVARLAEVSPATVSRVLNGNDRVDTALAERVLKAQAELGYRGNSLARGLRRKENNVIGVLVPDVTNSFFTDLVRSIEDAVRAHGILLVLCNTDETPEREDDYFGLLVDQQVAGIVVAPVFEHSTILPGLVGGHIPLVSIDREIEGAPIDAVVFDNFDGGKRLTAALLARHERVAAIIGPLRTSTGSARRQGYLAAFEAVDRVPDEALIIESDYSERGGYDSAHALFKLSPRPDAIFSANNLMTRGIIRAMRELGVTSDDVALATFTDRADIYDPEFTVLALELDTYEMGRIAAELLVERIRGVQTDARRVVLSVGTVQTV